MQVQKILLHVRHEAYHVRGDGTWFRKRSIGLKSFSILFKNLLLFSYIFFLLAIHG
jgi:hypothetical protein